MDDQEHYCENTKQFPKEKFFKPGTAKGDHILIVGEAPAPNGWRKSGRAFYTIEGKLLPTGRNLNKLLAPYQITFEDCDFTEIVKCFVGKNRQQLKICGLKCWPIFLEQIKDKQYNLIILLGKATLDIFNNNCKLSLQVGEVSLVKLCSKNHKVLPIYHPSPIGPYNHTKNIAIFDNLKQELKIIMAINKA